MSPMVVVLVQVLTTQISSNHDPLSGNIKTDYSTDLVDYWTMGNQLVKVMIPHPQFYSQVTGGQDLTGTSTSPFGHTITPSGHIIQLPKSVFGGSSIYFDGTDDYLSFFPSPDWNLVTGDFTIECWINVSYFGNQ